MESQPQTPEFRNNPENFHPCNLGTHCHKHEAIIMGESSKFQKNLNLATPILKLAVAVCPINIHNFKFKWSNVLRKTENKSKKLL